MTASPAKSEPAGPVSCLSCGATGAEPWATAWDAEYRTCLERFRYLRCRACGVLFIDPVPTERLPEIYPENYYSYGEEERSTLRWVKRQLDARSFRRLLRAIPGEHIGVLDVGGGAGAALSLLRSLDRRVTLSWVVDMDPRSEALARAAGHEYFRGRVEDFETSQRFDLILLLNLIEHVADPAGLLRRLHDRLAEEGLILVQTPNHDSLDARWFRHANWSGYHCPRHFVLFDRSSFTGLVERTGFAIRDFHYTQGAPFWAGSVLVNLAERSFVSITRERPVLRHPWFPPLAAGFASFDFLRGALGAKLSQMVVTLSRSGSRA